MELESPEEVFSISEYVGPAVPPAPIVSAAPAPVAKPTPAPAPAPAPVAVPAPAPVAAPAPKPVPKPLAPKKPSPAPEPVEDDWNPGSELDDAAALVLAKATRSSPWWLLSLLFHAGIFALLPIFIFSEQLLTEGDGLPIQIGFTKTRWDPDRLHARIGNGSGPIGGATPLEDPPIVFPGAQPATKNESANEDDHAKTKGDAADALAYAEALEGTGFHGSNNGRVTTDAIGVGGGGASSRRFGGRFGGRKDLVARGGGSGATESAVEAGLRWLARHQAEDGGWHSATLGDLCVSDPSCAEPDAFLDRCDTGVTALAVLAFLGAGYTPLDRSSYRDPTSGKVVRPGEVVRRGLAYLIGRQTADGGLDEAVAFPYMYDQALTTLALCEAYALTSAVHYRGPAQRGIAYLERARTPRAGWRYEPNCGESDVSVTGACVQALKSAKLAGLEVSRGAYEGVRRFVAQMTNKDGRTGYTPEEPAPTTTLTIVGLYCRLVTERDDPTIATTARAIVDRNFDSIKDSRLRRARRNVTDYYSSYYAMLSFYDLDGPSGPAWRKLNTQVTDLLMKKQELRGCQEGSWDARNDLWCSRAGRTCATAMNVLTLEVYYRYAQVPSKSR
jgi:hypothetical protein